MDYVNINEIDILYSNSGYPVYTWKMRPFTGIAFELYENGQKSSETSYVDGVEEGLQREWYPNGQVESETTMKWNRLHGSFLEWYENGQLKAEGRAELGLIFFRKDYNLDGKLIKEYYIEENLGNYELLLTYRKQFKNIF